MSQKHLLLLDHISVLNALRRVSRAGTELFKAIVRKVQDTLQGQLFAIALPKALMESFIKVADDGPYPHNQQLELEAI
jgi:hypothetical protein